MRSTNVRSSACFMTSSFHTRRRAHEPGQGRRSESTRSRFGVSRSICGLLRYAKRENEAGEHENQRDEVDSARFPRNRQPESGPAGQGRVVDDPAATDEVGAEAGELVEDGL